MSSVEDEEALGFSPAECRAWLEADVLAGLQEVRELCMDSARTLAAKMKEDDADLVRLNAALVKAARAVRQTSVLQLEVAGLRRQAGTREAPTSADDAANANQPRPGQPPSNPDYAGLGTYEYFVDDDDKRDLHYMDAEEGRQYRETLDRMKDAMDADLKAAGKLLELHQSISTKARDYIRHIPHPETDACIQSLRLGFVTHIFGEENMEPPRLKTGPPDTPTKWIADRLSPEVLKEQMRRRGYA